METKKNIYFKKNTTKRTILVTGAAGFIGYHTCLNLLKEGEQIIGFDNLNSYYDVELKKARLNDIKVLNKNGNYIWEFIKGDLKDIVTLENIFLKYKPEIVIHLAAQAGVRYSKEEPIKYINSNVLGFVNILECCKKYQVKNFIYASSSSVYGGNSNLPFQESDPVDHPLSLYAATKRSNELIAHSYSHIYGIPCIGLRFFTVYGPWGRPDMAPMIFTKSIINREPIKIFNKGEMSRDFTYIDDIVEIIKKLIDKPPKVSDCNPKESVNSIKSNPFLIFNIGCSQRIKLLEFIKFLEDEIGISSIKKYYPMQSGDVIDTFCDNTKIAKYTNYIPKITINEGIKKFVNWYKEYY